MVDIIKEWGSDIKGLSVVVGKNKDKFLFLHPNIIESEYQKLLANCPKIYGEDPSSKLIYFDFADPLIIDPNCNIFKIRWNFLEEERPLIVDHIGGKIFICYHNGEYYLFDNNAKGTRLFQNFNNYQRNGQNMIILDKKHVDGNYKYLLTNEGIIKKYQGELTKTFPDSGYYITYIDNGLHVYSFILFNNKGEAIKSSNDEQVLISYYHRIANKIKIKDGEISNLSLFERLIVAAIKTIPELNAANASNLYELVNYAYSNGICAVINLQNMQIYYNKTEKPFIANENRQMQLSRIKKHNCLY